MVDTVGPGSADDTFALLLRMRSGARAVLHQSAAVLGPRFQSLRVSGSDGTAWLDDAWRLWRVGRTGEPALVDVASDLAEPVVDVPSHAGPFASRELPSFVRLAQGFADAIEGRTRRPRSPAPPTFADGLACQRIMDAARASSRSGLRVDLFS